VFKPSKDTISPIFCLLFQHSIGLIANIPVALSSLSLNFFYSDVRGPSEAL